MCRIAIGFSENDCTSENHVGTDHPTAIPLNNSAGPELGVLCGSAVQSSMNHVV